MKGGRRGGSLGPPRWTKEEAARIRPLLPGREPRLKRPSDGSRTLPVSETVLRGNELAYLEECIRTNWISSQGPFVTRFEESFADAAGCRYGVACSSGTAALHLALAAIGISPGDEVILPAFTMIATANAVSYCGGTPVLVDSSPDDWNVDLERLEEKIGPRTRAIVIVHTYGRPVEMDRLLEISERHGVPVIEDAAEAHGARLGARPVGALGIAAAFSFYGNKVITTGEGGMVTTNDRRVAAAARRLRGHAFSTVRHFWHSSVGFNYRMTNLQAAVGLAQTEKLGEFVEARRRNARLYTERLRRLPGLTLPSERRGTRSVFWMYGLLVEDDFGCTRDELRRLLADRGIETRTFFVPIHLQPIYFRQHRGERYPVSENLCRRGLYLPSSAALTEADIDRVSAEIASIQQRFGRPHRASASGR